MSDYFTGGDKGLTNKLGIDDPEILKKAEADIVSVRLAELTDQPPQGVFDFKHLKDIHRRLFSDVYDFAGEIRTVDIAKESSVFCLARHIDAMQREVFGRLKKDDYFKGIEKEDFIAKLAEFAGDLNALHPFREGNGRTIRFFLSQLACNAGYDLAYQDVSAEEIFKADIASFYGDMTLLTQLFQRIIKPDAEESITCNQKGQSI